MSFITFYFKTYIIVLQVKIFIYVKYADIFEKCNFMILGEICKVFKMIIVYMISLTPEYNYKIYIN